MLSKLIKHEFRATSRIMWPVFLGMLALTALMRFSQLLLNGGHIPWLLQLIGVLLVIGFVMGLIVSAVWYAAAFIVGLLSLLIAASGWSTFQYVPDFFNDVFTAFFGMEASLRSHALLIVFELFCNFVFAVSAAEPDSSVLPACAVHRHRHDRPVHPYMDLTGRQHPAHRHRAAAPLGHARRTSLLRDRLRRDVVLHDEKTESRVTRFRKSSRERSPLFRLLFCALLSAKFPQGRKLCQPSASNSLV